MGLRRTDSSTEYFGIKRVVTTLAAWLVMLSVVTTSFDVVFAAKSKTVITDSDITAESAIAFSGSTSEVVLGIHEDRKIAIGDVEKLLNAMVVIDNMHNTKEYDNKVIIKAASAKLGDLYTKGQEVSVRQLISDMLTKNSDEAASALSRYSATKPKIFVSMMNSKIMEMGLMSTQLVNATGRYHSEQYSSAYDLAVIAQHAMRYDAIKDALMKNANVARPSGFVAAFAGDVGGPRSSSQAIVISERDGMQIITVLLDESESGIQKDADKLTKYAFANATSDTIVKAGKRVGTARVKHGNIVHVGGYTKTKGYAYIPPEGSDSLVQTRVVMREGLEAPLKKGAKIGEYRIYVADELKGTVDIVTDREIKTGWFPSYIYISNMTVIIIGVILLVILFFIMRIRHIKRMKKKQMERRRKKKIREMAMQQMQQDEDRARRNWTYH